MITLNAWLIFLLQRYTRNGCWPCLIQQIGHNGIGNLSSNAQKLLHKLDATKWEFDGTWEWIRPWKSNIGCIDQIWVYQRPVNWGYSAEQVQMKTSLVGPIYSSTKFNSNGSVVCLRINGNGRPARGQDTTGIQRGVKILTRRGEPQDESFHQIFIPIIGLFVRAGKLQDQS